MTMSSSLRDCSNLYWERVNYTTAPTSIEVDPLTGEANYQTESGNLAMMKTATSKNPTICYQFPRKVSAVNHEWNVVKAKLATAYGALKERLSAPIGTSLRKRIFEICVNGALRTCSDELTMLKLSGAEDVAAFKKMEAVLTALKEENRNLSEGLHKSALNEEQLQRHNNELQAELKKSQESSTFANGVLDGLQDKNNALTAEECGAEGQNTRGGAGGQAREEGANEGQQSAGTATGSRQREMPTAAELDEAKAAQIRLTDELAKSQRRNAEQQGALKLLERDGRKAQEELEKHRTTIVRLTEECKDKERRLMSLSARIKEILYASHPSTRSPIAPASSRALPELVRARQREEQLEGQLQNAHNDGRIQELSNQPACLICGAKRSEQTFMVVDTSGASGIGVCGHRYCTACLDQGNFRVCPVCKQQIVMRVPC
ncbi:hypothetical protein AAVH_06613 [Aphelenchoides avenae]|nr:hypothetical protein AAVH_06613 [Aphelenchus avenae]